MLKRPPISALTVMLVATLAAATLVTAALASRGRAQEPPKSPQTLAITIRHSRFAPARFTFRRGATVRFVITNTDPIDHEFILGDDAVQRRHETGTEPVHDRVPGEVSVPAGTQAETTYTFSRPGVLLIGCHAPGHYAYGMRGWVRTVD